MLALSGLVAQAGAVSVGDGDLLVTFDGGLSPSRLPRHLAAPVSVRVAGNVKSISGDAGHLPQLRRIAVAINSQGRLFDRGLPVCLPEEIQPATEAAARRICGPALVGRGHVIVQVRIPSQPPFDVKARLLAFNGPRSNGHKVIVAQAYARVPPNSFVLKFRVSHRKGTFGTVLSTTLPVEAQSWAYLTHFDMTLHRLYSYRGIPRSFVSAACAAPVGFRSAVFPFARATYGFASGQRLRVSETGICRVAG